MKHVKPTRATFGYQDGDYANMTLKQIQNELTPDLDWSTISWTLPEGKSKEKPYTECTLYDVAKDVVNWPTPGSFFHTRFVACAKWCLDQNDKTTTFASVADLAAQLGVTDPDPPLDGNHDTRFLEYIRSL